MFPPTSILDVIGNDGNANGIHVLADPPYPHAVNMLAGVEWSTGH